MYLSNKNMFEKIKHKENLVTSYMYTLKTQCSALPIIESFLLFLGLECTSGKASFSFVVVVVLLL